MTTGANSVSEVLSLVTNRAKCTYMLRMTLLPRGAHVAYIAILAHIYHILLYTEYCTGATMFSSQVQYWYGSVQYNTVKYKLITAQYRTENRLAD